MGVSVKVGAFSTGTAALNSTQDITCGFQPKAIIVWWSGTTSSTDTCVGGDSYWGMGFASQTERCSVTTSDDNAASSQGSSSGHREDALISVVTVHTGTFDGLIDIDSFANWPSDGFRLIVDDVMPRDLRVGFIAYGGSDITDVDIHRFNEQISTGNYDVAITGNFQPDMIFFLGTQGTADPPAGVTNAGNITFGAARSSSEQATLTAATDEGSASSDTGSYCNDLDVFMNQNIADPTAPNTHSRFVQMNSNGFRINQLTSTGGSTYRRYALCIKGGLWKLAPLTTQTDTSTGISISGLGGTPKGVLVASANRAESADNTPTGVWSTSIGAGTSTSERTAQHVISSTGDTNMRVITSLETDEIYINVTDPAADIADAASGTILGLMDIQTVGSDGYTFVMDDADPSGMFAWAVMVGEIVPAVLPAGVASTNLPQPVRKVIRTGLTQTKPFYYDSILDAGTNTVTITSPATTVSAGNSDVAAGTNTVTITAPATVVVAGNSDVSAGANTVTITAPTATLLATDVEVPFNKYGWPNPDLHKQSVWVKIQTRPSADPVGDPIVNIGWPNPRAKQLAGQSFNLNLVQTPLSQVDIVLSAGTLTVTITAPAAVVSAGNADVLAGTNTVTITAPTASLVAGNVDVAAGTNTVTITAPTVTLIDSGAPSPFTQTDWKLPRRTGRLFTRIQTRPAEDVVAAGDPIVNIGWPNPKLKKVRNPQHLYYYVLDSYDPFPAQRWPNPRRAALRQQIFKNTFQYDAGAVPFSQTRWVTPTKRPFSLDWRQFGSLGLFAVSNQTLDANANTITITAPATSVVVGDTTVDAGAVTVTITAPTATVSTGSTLDAGSQLVTFSAPDVSLGLETSIAAGTNTATITAPTAVGLAEKLLDAGANTVTITSPVATISGGAVTLTAGTNTIVFTAPLAFLFGAQDEQPSISIRHRGRSRLRGNRS